MPPVLPERILITQSYGWEGQSPVKVDVHVHGDGVAVEVDDPLNDLDPHKRGTHEKHGQPQQSGDSERFDGCLVTEVEWLLG